ncbi:hypothetical protein GCM10014715_80840 [Streptomyces spiralis]|uniref:Uncharacterized protein n=1 Tax=Streptomyces spiralis TaxID=66376 RepID=A0A919AK14_9ACTN|nr:hypothetical protein [Streptomyces spiralis]GHF13133.1 hypothetical protein GCM10014715_80840 [Streptomyces spiralis]
MTGCCGSTSTLAQSRADLYTLQTYVLRLRELIGEALTRKTGLGWTRAQLELN